MYELLGNPQEEVANRKQPKAGNFRGIRLKSGRGEGREWVTGGINRGEIVVPVMEGIVLDCRKDCLQPWVRCRTIKAFGAKQYQI